MTHNRNSKAAQRWPIASPSSVGAAFDSNSSRCPVRALVTASHMYKFKQTCIQPALRLYMHM